MRQVQWRPPGPSFVAAGHRTTRSGVARWRFNYVAAGLMNISVANYSFNVPNSHVRFLRQNQRKTDVLFGHSWAHTTRPFFLTGLYGQANTEKRREPLIAVCVSCLDTLPGTVLRWARLSQGTKATVPAAKKQLMHTIAAYTAERR